MAATSAVAFLRAPSLPPLDNEEVCAALNEFAQELFEKQRAESTCRPNEDEFVLEQLVLWVTHPATTDRETERVNERVLLLFYPAICSSRQLIRALETRYFSIATEMPIFSPTDEEEKDVELNDPIRHVQLKIVNMTKYWLRTYWKEDFGHDERAQEDLQKFLHDICSVCDDSDSTKLKTVSNMLDKFNHSEFSRDRDLSLGEFLERQSIGLDQVMSPRSAGDSDGSPFEERADTSSESIFSPRRIKSFWSRDSSSDCLREPLTRGPDFLSYNFTRLSNQITLMDFHTYARISPRECVGKAWKKEDGDQRAPNIVEMIAQFNNLAKWVQVQVLSERSPKPRGRAIKRVIKMAQRFRELRNYNSMLAVISALISQPIYRLEVAWSYVPKKWMDAYNVFKDLFSTDNNYRNLRTELDNSPSPCIPHIGLFLQDLVFIDDGNQTREQMQLNERDESNIFNFNKARRLADRIEKIRVHQLKPYDLAPDWAMQKRLYDDMKKLEKVSHEFIYNTSTDVKISDERR